MSGYQYPIHFSNLASDASLTLPYRLSDIRGKDFTSGLTLPISRDLLLSDFIPPQQGINFVFGTPPFTRITQTSEFISPRGANLGASVSVSGNVAVVGDITWAASNSYSTGRVYTFDPIYGTLQQTLTHPNPVNYAYFGISVCVSGNDMIIGTDKDAAYVYTLSSNNNIWSLQSDLPPPTGATGTGTYGNAVSISGDYAIVGARKLNVNGLSYAGSAYIFARSGTTWTHQQTITSTHLTQSAQFGYAVSIDGDYAVIGSPKSDSPVAVGCGIADVYIRSGTVWTHQQTLYEPTYFSIHNRFGHSVSIRNDYIIVGEPIDRLIGRSGGGGAVHVFQRSGTTWTSMVLIRPPDVDVFTTFFVQDFFGESVSMGQDLFVVGAPRHNSLGYKNSGSVYLYEGSGSTWTLTKKFVDPNPSNDEQLGVSVSTSNAQTIAGYASYLDWNYSNPSVGRTKVNIYAHSGIQPALWIQQGKLVASDAQSISYFGSSDYFAKSVSIYGDYAIVGAFKDDDGGTDAGAAFIFVRSGTTWTQQAKLVPSDIAASDYYGYSVSIYGDYAVVGSFLEDPNGLSNAGSVYVFVRSGTTWTEQAKLVSSDIAAGDRFASVSIYGDYIIVGASEKNENGLSYAGVAYIFVRSGTTWTQQAKLVASDLQSDDRFGLSVSISGGYAIMGAYGEDPNNISYAGSAYIFVRSGTTWTQQAKLVASDAESSDYFGYSVSIYGDYAIVGSFLEDTEAVNAGAAYIFVRSGTTWTQQAKLVASDAESDDRFGQSVSIYGDYAIVGAPNEDTKAANAGAAYIFVRSGTTWTQQEKIVASDGLDTDQFGDRISIYGNNVIIGAPFADPNGLTNAGAAYVFTGPTQTLIGGQQLFTSSGSFVVPVDVTSVSVVCVGGGGGSSGGAIPYSGTTFSGAGGGGGGLAYGTFSVTPGDTISVMVGYGGSPGYSTSSGYYAGNGSSGGSSYVTYNGNTMLRGYGGYGGIHRSTSLNSGGNYYVNSTYVTNGGGGNGGYGGASYYGGYGGGGGGAGGYGGNGGNGGSGSGGGTSGSSGGGGGGGTSSFTYVNNGGGVGVLGMGSSGSGGSQNNSGGSGSGGSYGYGGGGVRHNAYGGRPGNSGAVRIIWGVTTSGASRYYPYTNTGNI